MCVGGGWQDGQGLRVEVELSAPCLQPHLSKRLAWWSRWGLGVLVCVLGEGKGLQVCAGCAGQA